MSDKGKRILLAVIAIVYTVGMWSGLAFLQSSREDPPYLELDPFAITEVCIEVFGCACSFDNTSLSSVVVFEQWKNRWVVESIDKMFKLCSLDVINCVCQEESANEWRSE